MWSSSTPQATRHDRKTAIIGGPTRSPGQIKWSVRMAVEASNMTTTAAAPSSGDVVSAEDQAKFEEAFLSAMPQAAAFMLMTVAQDGIQEMASVGDENSATPDP
jgi:hypothetical protein